MASRRWATSPSAGESSPPGSLGVLLSFAQGRRWPELRITGGSSMASEEASQIVLVGDAQIDLRVAPALAPGALRAFLGATLLDTKIDGLAVPSKPIWLWLSVSLLRIYRRLRPQWVSNRCVFDPSCSRYAEAALRKHGLLRGAAMTFDRLRRCKPGAGAVDVP